mgnify:CR=1 FL=1
MIDNGLEGLIYEAPHKVYIVNVTMVSIRSNSLFFCIQEDTDLAYMSNNILAGVATVNLGLEVSVVDGVGLDVEYEYVELTS